MKSAWFLPICIPHWLFISVLIVSVSESAIYASSLDTIGVTLLRGTTTNLDGSGVGVAQVEAELTPGGGDWEVNPSATNVNYPVADFTWFSTNAATNTFPNALGIESAHSDNVAADFYGLPAGVSTNVAHVDNFEADDFFFTKVPALFPIGDRVVNQSFAADVGYQYPKDQQYDDYADTYDTLFVSGAGYTFDTTN